MLYSLIFFCILATFYIIQPWLLKIFFSQCIEKRHIIMPFNFHDIIFTKYQLPDHFSHDSISVSSLQISERADGSSRKTASPRLRISRGILIPLFQLYTGYRPLGRRESSRSIGGRSGRRDSRRLAVFLSQSLHAHPFIWACIILTHTVYTVASTIRGGRPRARKRATRKCACARGMSKFTRHTSIDLLPTRLRPLSLHLRAAAALTFIRGYRQELTNHLLPPSSYWPLNLTPIEKPMRA